MADEINITQFIQVVKGNYDSGRIGAVLAADMAGDGGGAPGFVEVGTSEEDIDLSEITTLGWCFMRNLDSTNFVEWGKKDGSNNMQAIGRMGPGEPALFRLNQGVTLRMKADTAACNVQILVWDN